MKVPEGRRRRLFGSSVGRAGLWSAVLAAAMLSAAGCKTKPPEDGAPAGVPVAPAGPHADLLRLLPLAGDVADWVPASSAAVFGLEARPEDDVQAIQDDLGPAARLFEGYAYVKSAALVYTRGQPDETVTLRVHVMEDPSEAFGLFSVRTEGTKFPTVGAVGGTAMATRMTTDALALVKDRYCVEVAYAGPGSPSAILMEFGNNVADRVASRGYPPAILQCFPPGALDGRHYYLHTFDTLQTLPFFPVSDPEWLRRVLGLGQDIDMAIMGYPTERHGVVNYLFAIKYPTGPDAESACEQYKNYLDASTVPAEQNIALTHTGDGYLVGTLNAEENSIQDRLAYLVDRGGG